MCHPVYLVDEYDGPLQEEPEVALVPHPVVHGGVAAVLDPAGQRRREEVADGQAEQPDDNLVNLRGIKILKIRVARWQNLIPSFPWIAPGWRAWGRNPRKGRDQILQRSVAEP